MASNQTSSYGLSQWEATDAVQRLEFNADNAKVDAALKSLSDQVVQKANQSALNTVISAVNQKADAATVSSLSQTVAEKADSVTVAALSQTVAQKADQTDVDALANKAGAQLIQRTTLSQAESYCYIELSNIDWAQWATVTIRLKPVLMKGDSFRIDCNVNHTSPQLTYNSVTQAMLHLLPYFDGEGQVMGLFFPGNQDGTGLVLTYTYTQLEQLTLYSTDYNFQPGSVFEVWGTK